MFCNNALRWVGSLAVKPGWEDGYRRQLVKASTKTSRKMRGISSGIISLMEVSHITCLGLIWLYLPVGVHEYLEFVLLG